LTNFHPWLETMNMIRDARRLHPAPPVSESEWEITLAEQDDTEVQDGMVNIPPPPMEFINDAFADSEPESDWRDLPISDGTSETSSLKMVPENDEVNGHDESSVSKDDTASDNIVANTWYPSYYAAQLEVHDLAVGMLNVQQKADYHRAVYLLEEINDFNELDHPYDERLKYKHIALAQVRDPAQNIPAYDSDGSPWMSVEGDNLSEYSDAREEVPPTPEMQVHELMARDSLQLIQANEETFNIPAIAATLPRLTESLLMEHNSTNNTESQTITSLEPNQLSYKAQARDHFKNLQRDNLDVVDQNVSVLAGTGASQDNKINNTGPSDDHKNDDDQETLFR
jgi:hypothetical protein